MKTKNVIPTVLLIIIILNKVAAQEFDMDIYPPDSLKGKGILLNMNIKKKALYYDKQWWLSEGPFSLNAELGDYSEKIVISFDREHPNGYSDAVREYQFDIPAGPFRVCGWDDENYHISSRYPKQQSMMVREYPAPSYIRIKKSEMDSLGFQFVSCEQLVELYTGYIANPVGLHILPPMQVVSPEPIKDGMNSFRGPYPYFLFYILRSSPSLYAPFLSMVEPCPQGYDPKGHYQCEVVSKTDYWYELKVKFGFMFGGINWDGYYDGGTYTGYWQAPFDEAGFPYVLVDMIGSDLWMKVIDKK